ncbi:MAG: hypothetical protein NT038_02555 [Euryarchaeota archaeon]|nr:hypothetical protein [Euryarchaeota archaeon]
MKGEMFLQTDEMKKNMVKILANLDDVRKVLEVYPELQTEAKKLVEVRAMVEEFRWNLDEIEHLTIVSSVGGDKDFL